MENEERSTKSVTVTLDTNVLNHDIVERLEQVVAGLPIYLAHTSVTEREIENTDFTAPGPNIPETGVYGESRWSRFVWGSDHENLLLESILSIISPGYPRQGAREKLTTGQIHQLRDAMILVAHTRSKRDIFVTDEKFIKGKRNTDKSGRLRKQLAEICQTQIMYSYEFMKYCEKMRESK